ncbi:alpha-hydroxy acid oxidase [Rhizobium leguminosarum]|uniref:alpha-hydroxy acid oxidase n=1 Tax=Rhizobium leguminosarum TaxID=384 RepID=UPI0014420F47|nr:alpha-hydroxy acid oxidase [Rhizobium leguminosarum]NKK65692.1 alpha-hydroxy-acid oxidizing protein [Rhizobium leguminosarum bv. viciae]NKL06053.1 alpha-hydroxy-acid oxidizing protein [Rhizobium leguminosarum bv. viciae]NKL86944.1 alpha-hydroxy-acid oxidizing protein [Rhizobium leguminosarum bv. viciae]NKL92378.1 alpha-hydroxy-acid oxidizing protein [Rhizobium leguminosarum bv. viciae]NKM92360.1 alpha-hydroxy-acid oxidizing protein [Rhizobium leguminosarum bv. viciae]
MTIRSGNTDRSTRLCRDVLCLDDFEIEARRHLPKPLFGYIAGATETNASLRHNAEAFQAYAFRPRVLRDVSKRSTETSLFGKTHAAPFGIAPMGISALMAYRGDIVLAQGADQSGIPMIISGSSLIPLEEIAAVSPQAWFQAYLPGEPDRIDALIDRVGAAGLRTLLLTVDTATLPNRENNVRAGFSTPLRPGFRLAWQGISHPRWTTGTFLRTIVRHGIPHFENSYATRGAPIISSNVTRDFGRRDHLNWNHLERIRNRWSGKLVVKGIMHPDDAARAVDTGADGVIVSNHGGRQLDGTASPLQVLPEIASRVGDRVAVMVDGGFRRGTDIMKALALGACFVFVGRPFLYAAAVAGLPGVLKAADILKTELHSNMALLGVAKVGDISVDYITRT